MGRIGAGLLKQSQAAQDGDKRSARRDILSLLIQANNTMQDLPETQRMDDEQVMARAYKLVLDWCTSTYSPYPAEIPTFLIAGHETTRYAHILFPQNISVKR